MSAAERFGQCLREARQLRGLTIEQVASESHVPVGHVEALECGRLSAIPGGMYRRAEARAYAEVVGLDPAAVLADLGQALQDEQAVDGSTMRRAAPAAPAAMPRAATGHSPRAPVTPRIARALVVLALGAAALLWEGDHEDSRDNDAASAALAAIDPASVIEEAMRTVEPPRSAPALTRVLFDPRIAANGRRWPRDGRLDEGVLVVQSTPRGARVTVNGVGWGETPVAIRYLPLGTLRVRLGKDDYRVQERVVHLTAERPSTTLRVALAPLATRRPAPASSTAREALVITTKPAGARVTVNGIGWGTTPVAIPHVPPGAQRVRVVKDHFRSEERVVTIREGRSSRLTIELKPAS